MVRNVEARTLPLYRAGEIEVPFVILGMGETVEREVQWAEHSHPTHELLWNSRGTSTVTIGERTWTIATSSGLWIPAGVVHSARAAAGTTYHAAQFAPSVGSRLEDEVTAVEATPLLRMLLERLTYDDLSPGSRELTERMVLDVLRPARYELVLSLPQSASVQPIVAVLSRDPGDRRSLAAWSEELGVSERTITRAFTRDTGVGFAQWQQRLRMQRAVVLIAGGSPIAEAAHTVGYVSASAFTAAFRRVLGVNPRTFVPDDRTARV